MKSILQKKDGTCYLCMMLHGDYSRKTVQEHHVIFGTANRRLSERYGLKVYLCLLHHEEGPEAVHKNVDIALMLKVKAQKVFSRTFPDLEWLSIFGKNYDTEKRERELDVPQKILEPGFKFLPQEKRINDDEILNRRGKEV